VFDPSCTRPILFSFRQTPDTVTMQLSRLGLLVASLVASVGAQSTFTPARPPAAPLAVKSPYLSTWLTIGSDGGDGGYLAGEWPVFWQ
jgi:hypothetical protein